MLCVHCIPFWHLGITVSILLQMVYGLPWRFHRIHSAGFIYFFRFHQIWKNEKDHYYGSIYNISFFPGTLIISTGCHLILCLGQLNLCSSFVSWLVSRFWVSIMPSWILMSFLWQCKLLTMSIEFWILCLIFLVLVLIFLYFVALSSWHYNGIYSFHEYHNTLKIFVNVTISLISGLFLGTGLSFLLDDVILS